MSRKVKFNRSGSAGSAGSALVVAVAAATRLLALVLAVEVVGVVPSVAVTVVTVVTVAAWFAVIVAANTWPTPVIDARGILEEIDIALNPLWPMLFWLIRLLARRHFF
jgi:hypothetical protein